MRRVCFLLLACFLTFLVACGPANTPTPPNEGDKLEPIRIGGLTGPTSMGMVQLMEAAETGEGALPYSFTIAGSADELIPKLVQGELDMAAIPANLASILYQNTNESICVLAVNTLGVLSIVEKGGESIHAICDLKGKTIYATGKGSTPEFTLRYLLSANGLDPDQDVSLSFHSEPTEVVSLLAANPTGITMLPQPFVTVAQQKVDGLRIAIDLTEAWDALQTDSALITGVMVARRDFVEANPALTTQFLSEYEASIHFSRENVVEAAALCEEFSIVKAAVAQQAIPRCNLIFLAGTEMKTALSGYLEVLYAENPASVGKALPDDGFYFLP